MGFRYPRTFDEIGEWARQNGATIIDARARFAQYVILRAISASDFLSAQLVLKGGNALDFVWNPNRSTKDLDFSVNKDSLDENLLKQKLDAGLAQTTRELSGYFATQKIAPRQHGDVAGGMFTSYQVKVGYALRDEPKIIARLTSSPQLKLEDSLNWSLMSQTDKEYVDRRVYISIMLCSASTTYPLSYP
jgi:hypothetical protein